MPYFDAGHYLAGCLPPIIVVMHVLCRRATKFVPATLYRAPCPQSQTAGLMAAVSSLPQLRERKRIIDKHTNMLTAILDAIKERGLDSYYHLEEACLGRKATLQQVADAVQVSALSERGPKTRIRLLRGCAALMGLCRDRLPLAQQACCGWRPSSCKLPRAGSLWAVDS